MSQRVDYDTFKNMVLTAHLKPITAPNKRSDGKLRGVELPFDGREGGLLMAQ